MSEFVCVVSDFFVLAGQLSLQIRFSDMNYSPLILKTTNHKPNG